MSESDTCHFQSFMCQLPPSRLLITSSFFLEVFYVCTNSYIMMMIVYYFRFLLFLEWIRWSTSLYDTVNALVMPLCPIQKSIRPQPPQRGALVINAKDQKSPFLFIYNVISAHNLQSTHRSCIFLSLSSLWLIAPSLTHDN